MNLARLFLLVGIAMGLAGCVTLAQAEPVHFSLQDMADQGGRYDTAAHLGKPMVLEFYFNGCRYCRDNSPNVKALSTEWHGDRAQILEISIDCELSDYANWIERYAADGPVLNDCDGEALGQSLGVSSYPTTIVLDKDHKRVWSSVGVWSAAKKAKIRQLLSAPTSTLE